MDVENVTEVHEEPSSDKCSADTTAGFAGDGPGTLLQSPCLSTGSALGPVEGPGGPETSGGEGVSCKVSAAGANPPEKEPLEVTADEQCLGSDKAHNAEISDKNISGKEVFKMPMLKTTPIIISTEDILEQEKISKKDPEIATNTTELNKIEIQSKKTAGSNLKPLSPAEELKQSRIPIPYKEPKWCGVPDEPYSFEVIKNGSVVATVNLNTKSFLVFGRLPSCDVTMDHPSLSRYHAVVQYCAVASERHAIGWYLYDLDSTHGTWVNKVKVKPRVYIRIRVGYVVKFAGSTRLHVLQGPDEDKEEESEQTISEMKAQREQQKKEIELRRQTQQLDLEKKKQQLAESAEEEETGCSWGIDDEDAEEEIDSKNPFALPEPQDEELYINDPKKSLRGFFEREGLDLPEYVAEEVSHGKYKCSVELPIDTPSGQSVFADVTVSGKKKEAVAACALEACRLLDRYGMLRQAQHESRARKKKNWEDDDFYDSDDDIFLDRTGAIEQKRAQRMKRVGKKQQKAETYDSLMKKLEDLDAEIKEIDDKLERSKAQSQAYKEEEGMDAFDAFMEALKSGQTLDTKTKMKLKRQVFDLRQEKQKIERLANIAKPALPSFKKPSTDTSKPLPVAFIGRRKGVGGQTRKVTMPATKVPAQPHQPDVDVEEEEEEEGEGEQETEKDEVVKTSDTSDMDNNAPVEGYGTAQVSTRNPPLTDTDCQPHKSAATKSEMDISKTKAEEETIANKSRAPDKGDMDNSSSAKVYGPGLPSGGQQKSSVDDGSSHSHEMAPLESGALSEKRKSPEEDLQKRPKKSRRQRPKQRQEPQQTSGGDYGSGDPNDPDYATWLPPAGQSGDGKTKLNEKYGY